MPCWADTTATLQREDEEELGAFLALHSHSSMYLRAELRRDTPRNNFSIARRQGVIVGAAVQAASGMIALQAPVAAGDLCAAILRNTQRRLAGFFGPAAQVQAARHDLGLDGIALLKDTHEDLFALDLNQLRLTPMTACREAVEADFEHLVAWRSEFRKAALGDVEGEHLGPTSRADIAALLPAGSLFILEGPEPLSCCSFNARLPDMVQVGNVWTPPELRGNGYARAVVAGALEIARKTGVTGAVLSTGRKNLAAQAAYRSIGFELVGDYATVRIAPETKLPAF
jgi:ribosomal protein S18 acetylase RimI-like enzyme